jgi:hypothetical protein
MEKFIGTRIVEAKEMTRLQYNNFRGWLLPEDENGDDDGYMIRDLSSSNVSWLDSEEFSKVYKSQTNNMTFGLAIESMKMGYKVCRKGWNGKGMWLRFIDPYTTSIKDSEWDDITRGAKLLPWIGMRTVDNKFVPWLASQTDMLSEDWMVL